MSPQDEASPARKATSDRDIESELFAFLDAIPPPPPSVESTPIAPVRGELRAVLEAQGVTAHAKAVRDGVYGGVIPGDWQGRPVMIHAFVPANPPGRDPDGQQALDFIASAARGCLGIRHDSLATVLEVLRGENIVVMLEELAPGRPLTAELCKDWRQVVEWVAQAARGAGALHAAGRYHGRIRPARILVDGRRATLVGTSWAAGHCMDESLGYYEDMYPTPPVFYLAPEHVALPERGKWPPFYLVHLVDEHRGDPRTDVWCLAAVLYDRLAGYNPWQLPPTFDWWGPRGQPSPLQEALRGPLSEPPPGWVPLSRPGSGAPEALCAVVDGCLAVDPSRRLQDGNALAAALEDALGASS